MRIRHDRSTKAFYTPRIDFDLIDALTDPVIVKDNQHRILLANQMACVFTGRTRRELTGKTDQEVFSKERADVSLAEKQIYLITAQEDVNGRQERRMRKGLFHHIHEEDSVRG